MFVGSFLKRFFQVNFTSDRHWKVSQIAQFYVFFFEGTSLTYHDSHDNNLNAMEIPSGKLT